MEAADGRAADGDPGEFRDLAEQSADDLRDRLERSAGGRGRRPSAAEATRRGVVGFYKSTDARRALAARVRQRRARSGAAGGGRGGGRGGADTRPLGRIGGGDLPTIAVDPKNENVVYSASTVFWRTEDGGLTWSAVRGAPGGDDYQKAWINPNNPNILLVVSDQGGVVSANRGASWSNWYTQPTAAMYHVTTDNAFPYRVCGGQQDSGSACVDSRVDGRRDHVPRLASGEHSGIRRRRARSEGSRHGLRQRAHERVALQSHAPARRRTSGRRAEARGRTFNRNVRTMPIDWSPVDPNVLFYASNAVWKTVDRAHSWTRISGDLTRQTWDVPANAGKYARQRERRRRRAASPRCRRRRSDVKVLWAGTDDGHIQVTMDGGAKWTNVTPPQIKPWTRIFNIDAGHFDNLTAYAAANTMRLDDLNPHFWRTHDGGKTWTEINTGIAPGAVANSIREDPRKKGLLYAATDMQVWVSFDDGDHWQSLRGDMPAISVRDIRSRTTARVSAPISSPARTAAASGFSTT